MTAFQFSFITKGQAEWAIRAVTEQQTRDILRKFPEFNATIYDGDSAILDLLLTVKLDLIGSMAVTVLCMTLICSVFIHNTVGVLLSALTISSVCFGEWFRGFVPCPAVVIWADGEFNLSRHFWNV